MTAGEQAVVRVTRRLDSPAPPPVAKADGDAVIIAWVPPLEVSSALQLNGGEPTGRMHLTLAFIEDTGAAAVASAIRPVLEAATPLAGTVAGLGIWEGEDGVLCAVALADVPGISELRTDIVRALDDAGIAVASDHGFSSHITLAYSGPGGENFPRVHIPSAPDLAITSVSVLGPDAPEDGLDVREETPLGGKTASTAQLLSGTVLKSDEEMRFTLAPLYAPMVKDTHGEYIESRELQLAAHDYVRRGDLRLRIMHKDGRDPETIGDVVEMFALPWPIEIPMTLPDGKTDNVRLPAGTVLTGVVWDERAWPAVKDGRIGGLSLGGTAVRVDGEDVPLRNALDGAFVRVAG